MITVYGYVPAWGLPDISPYVTKLIYWLKMNKIPFEYKSQDVTKIDEDSPYGKLPFIVDSDAHDQKVGDSNLIIEYLTKKHDVKIDADLSTADHAVAVAFDRLLGEHLYWSGVIQPRWREDAGFEIYVPYIVPGIEVTPELRALLDGFRGRIVDEFNGQGMGRRNVDVVLTFYQADLDALSEFLGDKPYFMGAKVHGIDAAFYALMRHLLDHPQRWKGSAYLETKKNIIDYMARMRKEYDM